MGVLGLGRLGSCLARALHAAQLTPVALASRRRSVAEQLASELPGAQVMDVDALAQATDVLFIAVPDASLRSVCEGMPLTAANALVHLSGVHALDVLSAAADRGAQVGALHPLQAFPQHAGVERFRGIHAGVEASCASLRAQLEQTARALGAVPFSLQGVDRAAYHAAAVFASNYVVALHAAAAEVWRRAGLAPETARSALAPLTLGAAQAISERELPLALTGPLARGDVASVSRHLDALQDDPARAALYRALARELLLLPLSLDPELERQLLQLLQGSG